MWGRHTFKPSNKQILLDFTDLSTWVFLQFKCASIRLDKGVILQKLHRVSDVGLA